MKFFATAILAGATSLAVYAQGSADYARLMDEAGAAAKAQNPCGAVALFEQAFAPDSAQPSPFDLFAAALSAASCPAKRPLAWRWLGQLSRRQPLPMQPRDLDNTAADPGLAALRADEAAWARWLAAMRGALAGQAAAAQARSRQWLGETQARALPLPPHRGRKPGQLASAPTGFALYFSAVPGDTVRVPYLVRVPAGYDPARPAPVVVYLHGGVATAPHFPHADPAVVQEPVFAAAPSEALVVYPFGRQSFGWVSQPAAFAQVPCIVAEVRARYRTDPARTTLAGMSNGGSAVLWFAAQAAGPFSRFVALSPAPALPLGLKSYGSLGQQKPCLIISAQDDDVYAYAAVRAAYERHRAGRPRWQLQTLPQGGHGFLYGTDGVATLRRALQGQELSR